LPQDPSLSLFALAGLPLVREGDDLAAMIAQSLDDMRMVLNDGDIVVVAQKIVSKAEGRLFDLRAVEPGSEAARLAAETGKDPRLVELILRESSAVIRSRKDVLIVAHRLGFVHANAGIDQSNVAAAGDGPFSFALLLPKDPDHSARKLRAGLRKRLGVNLGIIVNDSMGRAWRKGTTGQAIGCAGVVSLLDRRGSPDLFNRALEITEVGAADEIASAASFVMGQADEGQPVVVVRGAVMMVCPGPDDGDGVGPLLRAPGEDLFRV